MQPIMTFTQAATDYIKKMLAKEPGQVFRLSIKKTGCSGYSYHPMLVEKAKPTDTQLALALDLTIYIDTTWLSLLSGVQVDYIEEDKSGLKQKRLIFINPNENSRCGCGESFHVK